MAFTDPEKNVAELHLREGMAVVDLGAGTGQHAVAAGKRVGEKGRVYAVEVQRELLQNIKTAANEAKLANIDVIWGDIEVLHGTKIADNSADAALMTNVFFQVEDDRGMLAEAYRILKKKGKALIVDWADSFGGLGPHPRDVITEQTAKHMLEETGFIVERRFSAGDHHYGIIAQKP
ncbi:MAG: methyltransferase domain-containing protein [Patescibacteria group bacterium]